MANTSSLLHTPLVFSSAKILVVGGGVSGLALADHLSRSHVSYRLIEARSRFGGRVLSMPFESSQGTSRIDVGPSWFWRGQERLAQAIKRFDIPVFEQPSTGDTSYEDEQGRVFRGQGYGSMAGSLRLREGIQSLVEKLSDSLDGLHLNHRLVTLVREAKGIRAFVEVGDPDSVERLDALFERVVLCLPPRVAVDSIAYEPELSVSVRETMNAVPTWMAGHAKVIAVYETAFWRETGLSGDAMSRRGPLAEIHDASPASGGPAALFGFVSRPPDARKNREELLEHARAQLGRLFGERATQPLAMHLQDWAFQVETATPLDHLPLRHHPTYGLPSALTNLWNGRLRLASTETATEFGGYLEGALEAAEREASRIHP